MRNLLTRPVFILLLAVLLAIQFLASCHKKDYVEPGGTDSNHNVNVTAKLDGKQVQILTVQVFKNNPNLPWYLAEQNPGTIQDAALGIIKDQNGKIIARSSGGSVNALFERWPLGTHQFLIFVLVNGQIAMTRTHAEVREGYATRIKADFGPSVLLVWKPTQQNNLSIDFGRYSGKVEYIKWPK